MDTPTVDELVAALRTLGCEGPAAAADVLDQVDRRWPRPIRDQVLRKMAAISVNGGQSSTEPGS